MNEVQLRELVTQVVSQIMGGQEADVSSAPAASNSGADGEIPDLSAVDYRKVIDVPNPENLAEFQRMRENTMARVGVWRAGPRYRTNTYLRFRADHAAAMDAVFTDVPEELLERMGLFSVTTKCDTKELYLTRPDLGRQFPPEAVEELKKRCRNAPDVQIFVSDGLSSTAVVSNIEDLLPAILQGLKLNNVDVGTPFFVKHGRVGAEDAVTEILGSKVTVVLLGERPGLSFSESLSAYMTYGGYVGIPEAARTVVSNIHRGGTNPVEAGAHIAEIIVRMLREKASGLDLKL